MKYTGGKSTYNVQTQTWDYTPRVYTNFYCSLTEWTTLGRGKANFMYQLRSKIAYDRPDLWKGDAYEGPDGWKFPINNCYVTNCPCTKAQEDAINKYEDEGNKIMKEWCDANNINLSKIYAPTDEEHIKYDQQMEKGLKALDHILEDASNKDGAEFNRKIKEWCDENPITFGEVKHKNYEDRIKWVQQCEKVSNDLEYILEDAKVPRTLSLCRIGKRDTMLHNEYSAEIIREVIKAMTKRDAEVVFHAHKGTLNCVEVKFPQYEMPNLLVNIYDYFSSTNNTLIWVMDAIYKTLKIKTYHGYEVYHQKYYNGKWYKIFNHINDSDLNCANKNIVKAIREGVEYIPTNEISKYIDD